MTTSGALLLVWTVFVAAVLHRLGRRVGLNLADEGYLWYGVQRTVAGEVPIRDFRAYDPGRYWLCARAVRVVGDGVLGLRATMAVVGWVALLLGVVAASFATTSPVMLAAVVVLLAVWSQPRHKLFEVGLLVAAVLMAAGVVESGSVGWAIGAGLVVGASFVVGLNLGAYVAVGVAGAGVVALAAHGASHAPSMAGGLFMGCIIGASPLAVATQRNPGFWRAYVDRKLRPLIQRGTTNLPLPIPWPWRVWADPAQLPERGRWSRVLTGSMFLVAIVLPIGALTVAAFQGGVWVIAHPLVVASAVVAAPALHGMLSRADVHHLMQWSPPLLLLVVALGALTTIGAVAAAVGLTVATVCIAAPVHPAAQRLLRRRTLEETEVGDERLLLEPVPARTLRTLLGLASDRPHVALPVLVAIHAIGRTRSPVYDTFCVYPASQTDDERLRAEILAADPAVVLIDDAPLDDRMELRFRETHPVSWELIMTRFERACCPDLPDRFVVAHRPGLHP